MVSLTWTGSPQIDCTSQGLAPIQTSFPSQSIPYPMPTAPITTAVSTTTASRTSDIILPSCRLAPVFAATIFAAASDALAPELALLALVNCIAIRQAVPQASSGRTMPPRVLRPPPVILRAPGVLRTPIILIGE